MERKKKEVSRCFNCRNKKRDDGKLYCVECDKKDPPKTLGVLVIYNKM